MDESNKESETRMKEFINLKLMAVDGKIDAVKENVKDMDDRVHHRMKERDEFFTGWIQRMEDEIDTDRHNKTKQR